MDGVGGLGVPDGVAVNGVKGNGRGQTLRSEATIAARSAVGKGWAEGAASCASPAAGAPFTAAKKAGFEMSGDAAADLSPRESSSSTWEFAHECSEVTEVATTKRK